jgi:Ca2+-binding EF-hand superfamily protein/1-acyl-sn-glycerol-3-phosphate acyltransferase
LLLLPLLLLIFLACLVVAKVVPSSYRAAAAAVLVRPLAHLFLICCGLWVTEEGSPPSKKDAPVVISNHVAGMFEGVYLYARTGGAVFAEKSNFKGFVMATVATALGVHTFDREKTAGVRDQMADLARNPSKPQLFVFPEGTCSNGSVVLSFKTGAFSPGLPVAAVAVAFPGTPDPSWTSKSPVWTWAGLQGFPVLLLRALCCPWTPMAVNWLGVFQPQNGEPPRGVLLGDADSKLFARRVQVAVAEGLGVRCSTLSLDDVLFATAAGKARLADPLAAVVDMEQVAELVKINLAEAKAVLQEFAVHATGSSVNFTVNFTGFAKLLRDLRRRAKAAGGAATPPSAGTPLALAAAAGEPAAPTAAGPMALEEGVLQRLFDALDVHHEGKLNLREVLVGLALLNGRAQADQAGGPPVEQLRLAFAVLDEEKRGTVSRERLVSVLLSVYPGLAEERLAELANSAAGGGGDITEETFLEWAAQKDVWGELELFRAHFVGLPRGDVLKAMTKKTQ